MKIIVHKMMGYGLIVTNYVVVDYYHMNIFSDLVGIGFVAEFVYQEGVHMFISFPVGIGMESAR